MSLSLSLSHPHSPTHSLTFTSRYTASNIILYREGTSLSWPERYSTVTAETHAEYSLFYRALFQKRHIIFKEPTNRSHPILLSHIGHKPFLTAKVFSSRDNTASDNGTAQSFLVSFCYFAEYSLFYRTFLQKRPIILRSLGIVATPYYYPI